MELHPAAGGHQHVVAFFGNAEQRLAQTVAAHFSAFLAEGGGAIIVASPQRSTAMMDALPIDPKLRDRILHIDPAFALKAFMVEGRPDRAKFDAIIGNAVRMMHRRYSAVCAYGEMVGLLWQQGAITAALALEQLWNDLIERVPCDLICGYPIDVLGEEFQIGSVSALLSAHTKVVPSLSPAFDLAMRDAMDEILGDCHEGLRGLPQRSSHKIQLAMAPAEATILRLRHTLPRYVEEILINARRRYERTA